MKRTQHMAKPWYKSLTIKSALATGLTILLSPEVFNILPRKVAVGVGVAGAVSTAIGMRRAIPNPPQD